MAYKQNNNPFKKLHGDLQGFGERHAAWKAKREEMPQKKYGHFSEGAKAYRADKKAGESRFQYDIRMRKESELEARKEKSNPNDLRKPQEINIQGTPSWEYKTQEQKLQSEYGRGYRGFEAHLPPEPGDPFEYVVSQTSGGFGSDTGEADPFTIEALDTRTGKYHHLSPEDPGYKAIVKRYTGSESGDLSPWMKNPWKSIDYSSIKGMLPSGKGYEVYAGSRNPGGEGMFESHLTYEQMMELNNPTYKKKK